MCMLTDIQIFFFFLIFLFSKCISLHTEYTSLLKVLLPVCSTITSLGFRMLAQELENPRLLEVKAATDILYNSLVLQEGKSCPRSNSQTWRHLNYGLTFLLIQKNIHEKNTIDWTQGNSTNLSRTHLNITSSKNFSLGINQKKSSQL